MPWKIADSVPTSYRWTSSTLISEGQGVEGLSLGHITN